MTQKQPLTLLVHTRMASFEWGKAIIDHFYRQAGKRGFDLSVVERWQDVDEGKTPVLLLSVDKVFIQNCLEHLDSGKRRIILIGDPLEAEHWQICCIFSDQETLIGESVAHLRQCGCRNMAFFGAQKNDISDQKKANAFARLVSAKDSYAIGEDIEESFEEFFVNIHSYDSVICANDIVAIYLLGKCRERGISVPKQLRLVGNGNLWLSSHVTPPLTTAIGDAQTTAAIALQMCRNLERFPSIGAMDVRLKVSLICRASTCEDSAAMQTEGFSTSRTSYPFYNDSGISHVLFRIQKIDRELSALSEQKRQILLMKIDGCRYREIAEQMHLSEETVKYHLRTIYKQLEIHGKAELVRLFATYGITL